MKFKKGAIEIQFNWLFVLIIGAVILIIFSGIILRQKNISEASTNVLILNNLDAILSGSEVSAGTVNIVRIPDTRIEFSCNRYSIGQLSKQLDVMNVFTPSVIEGDRLITTTLDFSIPYRITNLVYLTSPNYRYIFIGQNEMSESIRELMPNETFSQFFSTLGEVNYRGEDKARFVFFDSSLIEGQGFGFNLKDYASLPDSDVTAINVRGNINSGEVEFFSKQDDQFVKTGAESFMGKESLLGAIFSDNPQVYSCTMRNVFEKISIVTEVYKQKTGKIRQLYLEEGDRCSAFLDSIYSLQNLNQISLASKLFTSANIASINNAATALRSQNRQAQLQSCATIY